jgi:hypothetical protein
MIASVLTTHGETGDQLDAGADPVKDQQLRARTLATPSTDA